MQANTCPKCGAPVAAGAQFCTYCGTTLPTGSAPLPSSGGPAWNTAPPPPPPPPTLGGRARPRPSRRLVVLVVVVVVILLVASFVAFELYTGSAPPVQVTYVYLWSPDNVCGLNNNETAYYGYNTTTNANDTLDFGIPNFNSTSCTIVGVTTNTTGFALTYVQVPLTIPGYDQNASMNITIQSPGTNFNGILNLIFR